MDRVRIGVVFISSERSLADQIVMRLEGGAGREQFFREHDGITATGRERVRVAVHRLFPGLDDSMLSITFARKAGCSQCPCSPGYNISYNLPEGKWSFASVPESIRRFNVFVSNRRRDDDLYENRLIVHLCSDGTEIESVALGKHDKFGPWSITHAMVSAVTKRPALPALGQSTCC